MTKVSETISLAAIRTFVKVAKLGSMKAAAEALHVTPGAVSQQIRHIEDRMDVKLFERSTKGLTLTSDGVRLMSGVHIPFQKIQDAIETFDYRSPLKHQTLRVTTPPSFAGTWLLPRIARFNERFPGLDIQIDTSLQILDLRHEPIDVAIRHGNGNYPGLSITRLLTPQLVPVATKHLLSKHKNIARIEDLLALPLLQDRDRNEWLSWFRYFGANCDHERAVKGTSYPDDALLLKAASHSQGVALVRDIYADEGLRAGQLEIAFNKFMPTAQSYFFVTRYDSLERPIIKDFRNWILSEIASAPLGQSETAHFG